MNNERTIQESTEDRISYYHCCAFLVTLPFDRFYSQLVLLSFLLHTLVYFRKSRLRKLATIQNLFLVSVLLVNIAGILYSGDKIQAWKDVQRQLAIGLFPIIFSLSGLSWPAYRNRLLQVFGITCVGTVLYLYLDAIRILVYYDLPFSSLFSEAFMNHNFSSPIGLHATYLSMYITLSLVFFSWMLLEGTMTRSRLPVILALLILSSGLLQLASRSVLIALAVTMACLLLFIPRGAKRTGFVALNLGIALVVLLGIFNIDSYRKRYVSGLKEDLGRTAISDKVMESRVARWELAWQLVHEKMWTGHGSGSEKRLLKEAYFEHRLYNSYLHELNAHNQYLGTWLKTGVWGLLVYFFTLLFGFATALKNRDPVFFAFMVLLSVVGFSENILDVNKGIFFYAFFFCLFVFSGKPFPLLSRLDSKNNP